MMSFSWERYRYGLLNGSWGGRTALRSRTYGNDNGPLLSLDCDGNMCCNRIYVNTQIQTPHCTVFTIMHIRVGLRVHNFSYCRSLRLYFFFWLTALNLHVCSWPTGIVRTRFKLCRLPKVPWCSASRIAMRSREHDIAQCEIVVSIFETYLSGVLIPA